jgi:hypothetical protein
MGQHAGSTVARADGYRRAEVAEQAPGVGDDQVSTGSQDPDELRQGGAEVRHMGERQGAHNDIDSVIGDRQLMQVGPRETGVRHVGGSSVEHRLRTVDADDTVAQLGEVTGMPSGAARHVERKADGQVVEDLADHGLLEIDELVPGLVVRLGPRPVPLGRGHRGEGHAVAPVVRRLHERPNLGDPRQGEVAVVLTREGAQQRGTFNPQQIGERVLVDHGNRPYSGCRASPRPAALGRCSPWVRDAGSRRHVTRGAVDRACAALPVR